MCKLRIVGNLCCDRLRPCLHHLHGWDRARDLRLPRIKIVECNVRPIEGLRLPCHAVHEVEAELNNRKRRVPEAIKRPLLRAARAEQINDPEIADAAALLLLLDAVHTRIPAPIFTLICNTKGDRSAARSHSDVSNKDLVWCGRRLFLCAQTGCSAAAALAAKVRANERRSSKGDVSKGFLWRAGGSVCGEPAVRCWWRWRWRWWRLLRAARAAGVRMIVLRRIDAA